MCVAAAARGCTDRQASELWTLKLVVEVNEIRLLGATQ